MRHAPQIQKCGNGERDRLLELQYRYADPGSFMICLTQEAAQSSALPMSLGSVLTSLRLPYAPFEFIPFSNSDGRQAGTNAGT
ncbi:hypothetical protein ACE6H2_001999 [Prunus campanulata]